MEPLTATLAASLTSLPILLYHVGRLSLIAPLANVLMLTAVPEVMVFGSLAVVGGMAWLPLGQVLAFLAWPFLQWPEYFCYYGDAIHNGDVPGALEMHGILTK